MTAAASDVAIASASSPATAGVAIASKPPTIHTFRVVTSLKMTRQRYDGCLAMETPKAAEVRRILDRYLIEVVEAYDLCPWARPARLGDEVAVGILWGAPTPEVWVERVKVELARPRTRVVMILAPELALALGELRAVRDQVTARIPGTGVAHFHPDATLDLATPARLVPFTRRSPDPLLQVVPLAILDTVRSGPTMLERLQQAQAMGGHAAPPRLDVSERIAATNHVTVSAQHVAITAVLDDIARDRAASYARVGISACRSP